MTDTLQKYQWSGINKQGNRDKGFIQAADLKDAQSELSRLGVEVISLESYDKKQIKLFSRKKKIKTLLVGGGVAANSELRKQLTHRCQEDMIDVFFPPLPLCLDNAAMIAGLAYHLKKKKGPSR